MPENTMHKALHLRSQILETFPFAIPRSLWRERNERIFRDSMLPLKDLLYGVVENCQVGFFYK